MGTDSSGGVALTQPAGSAQLQAYSPCFLRGGTKVKKDIMQVSHIKSRRSYA
jgi:hypothetical protein